MAALSPMRTAASSSIVQIAAVRPKALSFIRRIASSSERTLITPTTGPKHSSCMIGLRLSPTSRICGAT